MKYLNKFFSLEIMIFVIILIISIYSYLHIFTNSLHSSYSYSELFINYQAGFIRRGLSGEIIFWSLLNFGTSRRFSFIVFPVTVRQSPYNKSLSSKNFMTAGVPPIL